MSETANVSSSAHLAYLVGDVVTEIKGTISQFLCYVSDVPTSIGIVPNNRTLTDLEDELNFQQQQTYIEDVTNMNGNGGIIGFKTIKLRAATPP